MLKITNYGHACFKFSNEDLSIIFDPYQNIEGLHMPFVQANYCFCSHNHFDHCARQYIELIPTECHINMGKIIVPHDHHNGEKRGLNTVHIFSMGGYKIAHLGDIGCLPSREIIEQLKGLDIVLAPINGFYTLGAQELKQLIDLIKPRLLIPMHYYRKENDSGLKEEEIQIDIFKKIFDYQEIHDSSIVINEKTFLKPALIFLKSEGDIKK